MRVNQWFSAFHLFPISFVRAHQQQLLIFQLAAILAIMAILAISPYQSKLILEARVGIEPTHKGFARLAMRGIVHGFSIIALCFTNIVISKVNSPGVGFDPRQGSFLSVPASSGWTASCFLSRLFLPLSSCCSRPCFKSHQRL
jgi:hypothetical protein